MEPRIMSIVCLLMLFWMGWIARRGVIERDVMDDIVVREEGKIQVEGGIQVVNMVGDYYCLDLIQEISFGTEDTNNQIYKAVSNHKTIDK